MAPIKGQHKLKYWNEGRLNWQDFQERTDETAVSELRYFLGYKTIKRKYNDTIVKRIEANCYIDQTSSWVKEGFKNDTLLLYNQVIFDIVELHKRKLQKELDLITWLNEAESAFDFVYKLCDTEIERCKKECQRGLNYRNILSWHEKINDELSKLSAGYLSIIRHRNLRYGLHLDFGKGFFTESLSHHFHNNNNLFYGFDFSYAKVFLQLDGGLSVARVKKDYQGKQSFSSGTKYNYTTFGAGFGYEVINTPKIKVIPFAGFCVTELYCDSTPLTPEFKTVSVNYNCGIRCDYKISKKVKLLARPHTKEYVELNLRFRIFISKSEYYSDLKGHCINLSIGSGFLGNLVRFNY